MKLVNADKLAEDFDNGPEMLSKEDAIKKVKEAPSVDAVIKPDPNDEGVDFGSAN